MVNYNEVSLKNLIKEIAITQSFSGDAKIHFSKGRKKGEGYLGDIVRVVIEENGRLSNLVVKVSIKTESIRATVPVTVAYGNEIEFYERIYPTLQRLQRELNARQLLDLVPRFFKSCSDQKDEFLILENLKELGYHMMDPKQYFGEDLCKIIIERFGKFHALSFALKHVKPMEYESLVEKLESLDLAFMKHKGGFAKQCFEVIQKFMGDLGCRNDFLDYYVKNVDSILNNILHMKEEKYSCIIHGDGWSNNFMFKYKENDPDKQVEDFKLLDWQACYHGSPVRDLSFILYAGASREVLNNLDVYLKFYHDSLTDCLSEMKLDVEEIYPFRVLKEQWQIYCPYGLIRSMLATKVVLTNLEEIVDPAEGQESKDFFETIVYAVCDKKKLVIRVEDLVEHMKDIGMWK